MTSGPRELQISKTLTGGSGTSLASTGDACVAVEGRRASVWIADEPCQAAMLTGNEGGPVAIDADGTTARAGQWIIDLTTGQARDLGIDVETLSAGLRFDQRAASRFYRAGVSAPTAAGDRLVASWLFAPSRGIDDDVANPGPPGQVVLIDTHSRSLIAVLEQLDDLSAGPVLAVDSQRAVVATRSSVRWYSTEDGALVGEETGSNSAALAIALSAGGARVAVSRADRTVALIDLSGNSVKVAWQPHDERVHALAFHPDGGLLATGGRDRSIKLWDISSDPPREVGSFDASDKIDALGFNPSGDELYASIGREVVVLTLEPA